MKALKFNVIFIVAVLFSTIVTAQDQYERNYSENYTVNETCSFTISNKFGNIEIANTDEDKISIQAEVIVKARSKDKADKILDRIVVDITKTGDKVLAETKIDNVSGNNISFEINYKVKMPSYLDINLSNKYGEVSINALDGKTNISVMYGALNVNRISDGNEKPLSQVELGYCEMSKINEFNWGKLIVKYSKVEVDKGKALVVSSKYSKVRLGSFSSVVAESSYDDYKVSNVSNLVLSSKYSDLSIDKLTNKLKVENKYGNIKVERVVEGFEQIEIQSKYSNVSLGIDETASYKLDAKTEYATIKHGDLKIKQRIKESNSYSLIGSKGSGKATVYIRSEYGDVDLRP